MAFPWHQAIVTKPIINWTVKVNFQQNFNQNSTTISKLTLRDSSLEFESKYKFPFRKNKAL